MKINLEGTTSFVARDELVRLEPGVVEKCTHALSSDVDVTLTVLTIRLVSAPAT